ncbi:hypothetical protein EVAR_96080_1 [Eumeta japonica]|uniref:Uncharacterized protein n=1 Tax=Eumeta variegata TaxID=151549 RepID=A0A4C1VGJ4_EUMVA|nr:hypothetical protein EVAR_96080_1 [Eumeta japonica]
MEVSEARSVCEDRIKRSVVSAYPSGKQERLRAGRNRLRARREAAGVNEGCDVTPHDLWYFKKCPRSPLAHVQSARQWPSARPVF